ncbi:2-hydroxyacyl-CoA dehydratase subunit D [Chloroflexota bacterium]
MLATEIKRYKTKPIDCWGKSKELRDKYYKEMWEVTDKGGILASGSTVTPHDLLSGFGLFDFIGGEPYGGYFSDLNPELAMECFEALESRGFSTDPCAYMRIYWGAMLLDKSPWGRAPRPTFYMTIHVCDHHSKWYQFAAEHYGVPLISLEWPHSFTAEQLEIDIEYMAGQYWDAIEKIEKIVGRKCDDEKLIEGVHTITENMTLWPRICEYQRFIPSPFDTKQLVSLMVPLVQGVHRKETTYYLKDLLAEMQDRVENEIGSAEIEKARIWHVNTPPWFALRIMKYPRIYGAVILGPTLYHIMNSYWVWNDDYTERIPGKTVQEQGVELKTREDAVRFIAKRDYSGVGYSPGLIGLYSPMDPYNRDYETLRQMEKYQCQGAMLHINRGCPPQSTGILSVKRSLREHGIPAMTYEGSFADPRDLNEAQIIDSQESFLESMGLTKLSDYYSE